MSKAPKAGVSVYYGTDLKTPRVFGLGSYVIPANQYAIPQTVTVTAGYQYLITGSSQGHTYSVSGRGPSTDRVPYNLGGAALVVLRG
jgi:hypothetical protein